MKPILKPILIYILSLVLFSCKDEILPETFTNPVMPDGADPWVIRENDRYYYCYSRDGSIFISRSDNLHTLSEENGVAVWTPVDGTEFSQELWAPELHHLDSAWYIYVAADDGDNHNHRMIVLKRDDPDPLGTFEFTGKITDSSDKWAIDGTVYRDTAGELYFIWSGWEGNVNVAQNIYIARMSDPMTISGARTLISKPERDWEKTGNPLINEGPEVLEKSGNLFIVYSASGSWTDHYCLGMLEFKGGDLTDAGNWEKHEEPVFKGTENVISPGHASFTESPDGSEDWIVYHAAKYKGAAWDRNIRMQKFTWTVEGRPYFGMPVDAGLAIPVPSGSK